MNVSAPDLTRAKGCVVSVQTADGAKFSAGLSSLTRFGAAFEFFDPIPVFQLSQVLSRIEILAGNQRLFSGRAVISGLAHTGLSLVCEVKLDFNEVEAGFATTPLKDMVATQKAYDNFYNAWRKGYQISPELKTLVVDVEDFLDSVRQWLEQVEFGLRKETNGHWAGQEAAILEAVSQKVISSFNARHEQFEEIIYALPAAARDAHQDFVRRHWSKHFLCSPFGQRTFYKPNGYAGDYEMMNMIHRNQPEGSSLYAKLIHKLLVSQWPARSVRNRIAHLGSNITNESVRLAGAGRRIRILNVGCGPAREIQTFIQENPLSDRVDFTLIDFDTETLQHAFHKLHEAKRNFGRNTGVQTKKVSVYELIRESQQNRLPMKRRYDLIYCAGLFDYLAPATGRALIELWHGWLSPGGLLLVANMNDTKPFRNFIEFVLDWRLIYRDTEALLSLVPEPLLPCTRVVAECTTVNMFLHIRKARAD